MKRLAVLGIDTSCYTTSVAIVGAEDGVLLADKRRLLDVRPSERGLRQSDAVFQHTKRLHGLVEAAIREADCAILAVCASERPRPVEQSYMPVFEVGAGTARAIASALSVQYIPVTHQQGHIAAALDKSGLTDEHFIALHVSGGTTEAVLCSQPALSVEFLSGTLDLHAGQLIDRVGVALGLGFPAGPALEQLAGSGNALTRLKVSMEPTGVHFSGAEAQAMRWLKSDELSPQNIAAEVFSLIARSVAHMALTAYEKTGVTAVLLAGGVLSSTLIRAIITSDVNESAPSLRLYFARPGLSSDNAVGVALIGAQKTGGCTCQLKS